MWVTILPLIWLVMVTFTAGYQKIFSPLPRLGFLAEASHLQGALRAGSIVTTQLAQTQALIFNARLNALVCGFFMVLVTTILIDSIRVWIGILRGTRSADVHESPFVMSHLRPEEL
jgi:carbon starvation protein